MLNVICGELRGSKLYLALGFSSLKRKPHEDRNRKGPKFNQGKHIKTINNNSGPHSQCVNPS